ncbi:MAG TPA: YncE family protein [Longimicrobium sp.]|nr:YncE family protein [Longimicrobium sp.]
MERAHRIPRALAVCAALGVALPARPAAQEHEHHQQPGTASVQPASTPQPGEASRTAVPVRAEFATGPEGAVGTRAAREREAVEVRLRLTDPATGRPLTGLQPMAWVDVRRNEQTSLASCQQRVGAFVEATLHVRHGEINLTQPVDDLNGHYLVTLARGGTVVVIDPVKGFGRTRMLTAVPLGAEGADWAATPDDRRIFVTLPARGEVAVVNTHTWRVEARIPAGARPTRARMHPDGRRLWVSDQGTGVVVIDAERLAVVASIPTGVGPHAIAFSDDGATAFVASRGAGAVSVIDAAALRKTGEARTGAAPADVAWSTVRGAAFVVDEADGMMYVVDARGTVTERIPFAPGIRHLRFAPDPAHAHGGHGGGHGAAGNGNLAFVLNPAAGTLQIYDVAQRKVVRTLSGAPEPDQVAFTGQFAYVRAAGTASVALIPLANPTAGAVGPHDYFAAGSTVPGSIAVDSLGDVLVPQPGMHDAIYAANPAERMVYSYHYMEGMPVPHGGLTTYGFTPKAVRVVTRQVRETEPGVYSATLKIDRAGDYDLIFRSPEPYFLACYGFTVERDPAQHSARDLRIGVEPGGELRPGRAAVRFRVSDANEGAPVGGLDDFGVQLASTDGWRQRARGVAVAEGVYEAVFDLPAPGVYVASFEIPSRGVTLRDLSPVWITVQP